MLRMKLGLGALLASSLLVACGGSSQSSSGSGGGGGSTGAEAQAACASLSKARCQKHDSCSNADWVKANFTDESSCETRESLSCMAALAAPGTKLTPAHDQACASAIDAQACADLLGPSPPDACVPPAGARANGQPCSFNGQCQSTFCAVPQGAACGSCADEPKAGDSCVIDGNCGRGLVCSSDQVCIVPAAVGQDCHRDRDCVVASTCIAATKTAPGKCVAAGQSAGVACDAQKGPGCDRDLGLYCAPTTHVCTAVSFAQAGSPCGDVAGSGVACLAGAVCQIPAGSKTGTCAAAAADGAACTVGGEPHCLAPARCVAGADGGSVGTCEVPSATACG
jgi:hypothetical protein